MRKDSLLLNATINGTAQGLGRLVRFVTTSIAIVKFGATGWGEVAFAYTLITYINFVLNFGMSSFALIERPDDTKLDRKIFTAMGYIRGCLVTGFALVAIAAYFAMDFSCGTVLKIYLLTVFLRPINIDWLVARKGLAGINSLVQFFRQGLLLGLIYFLHIPSIEHFAVIDVGTELLATLALWLVGPRRGFSLGLPSREEWKEGLQCYHGSLILFVSSALLLLHQNVDIFFLKFFGGNAMVGVYDYCYRYALFVFLLGGSLSEPLRRQLARLKEFSGNQESSRLVLSSHKLLGLMSSVFLLFALLFSEVLFSKVVPIATDFSASRLLAIFACWLVVSFYSVPWSEWLISESRKRYLKLSIVAGVVNVASNICLVPAYGIEGAAFAKIISEMAIFGFLFFSVNATMRWNFLGVIRAHLLLVPCVVVFFWAGSVPVWLAVLTVLLEVGLILGTKYVSKRDFSILARN
ncbi:MAG: polysaccharide biosynthesis C-terminal domain-containing protein [Fibrobacter sp.]|nr:polysaccharide biosynthesis C-terminal domain-containing protein [Fibrobacter sp.]